MELGAQPSAHWSRHADQLVAELVEGVAQAKAQARPRKQRPHTFSGAVEAIGEGSSHLVSA